MNQFSRAAAFATAVNRRLLYPLTGNDVDDSDTLEMPSIAVLEGSGAHTAKARASYAGVLYSPSKYQPPSFMFQFLGHLHDWRRSFWSMRIIWAPKPQARENLITLCRYAVDNSRLSSGEASKIRGLAGWLSSSLAGRCLRGALYASTAP